MEWEFEELTFRCGVVHPEKKVYLSAKADAIQEQLGDQGEFTRVISHNLATGRWGYVDRENLRITSCCIYRFAENARCLASLELNGQVEFLGGGIPTPTIEKIPASGLRDEHGKNGHGYLDRIRFIGEHLYVCGSWGQLYRREADGVWTVLTSEFMGDLIVLATAKNENERSQWLDEVRSRTIHWQDIYGPAENDLYAVGDHGKIYHFDGQAWTQIPCDCTDDLHEIAILAPDDIWICGCNGAILRGNFQAGFKNLKPAKSAGLLYTSIHAFQGHIYLATYDDLFRWDEGEQRALPLITGLKPPIQDANQLDSANSVMWSFGLKDLAYTEDGKTWTRVHCPDNPKIG